MMLMKIMIWFHFYSQWNNFIIKSQLFPKFFSFSLFNLFLNYKSYIKLLKWMNWLIWFLWMCISSIQFIHCDLFCFMNWRKEKIKKKIFTFFFFERKNIQKFRENNSKFSGLLGYFKCLFFMVKIQKKRIRRVQF